MATAEQLRHEFERFMDANGIKYTVLDESDNVLALIFGGDTADTHVLVDFDEAGGQADGVNFKSEAFAKCNGSISSMYQKLNELNRRYRWVKFWVNDDGSIWAMSDAVVFPGSVGEECSQIAFRMSSIIESAIKDLGSSVTVNEETMNMLRMMTMMARFR